MRIALAQINPTLGDFKTNTERVLHEVKRAAERRCDLVVFPESTLFGYHPADLLERATIVGAQMAEFERLCKKIPTGIGVFVGLFRPNLAPRGKPYFNSAAFLQAGRKPQFFNKELLPTYDVFDDARHIERGDLSQGFLRFKGRRLLVTICEDIWAWDHPDFRNYYRENPLAKMRKEKVDLVVNLSASPFSHAKVELREFMVNQTARHFRAPMVYVNMVGAQDELIFDGGSFAVDAKGRKLAQCLHFQEDLNVVDLAENKGGWRPETKKKIEVTRSALVLGIRDFVRKCGQERVILGLSGGIDSAVVACLAVDALGPQRVRCVGLPGPFNAPESLELARTLAQRLGCGWSEISIRDLYQEVRQTLNGGMKSEEVTVMHENLQARIRGILLMALANREQSLVLATSNKDELACGYSTLYGDMCGALAPIGDLLKGEVYELANHYNSEHEVIPERILTRAPSAELRPNQTDQDSLPPYDELDRAVQKIVEKTAKPRTTTEKWLLQALHNSEFKRWQAPPILKVSTHSFGRGRRWPIAQRARE